MHLSMRVCGWVAWWGGLPQGIRQFWKNWGLIPYPCDTFLCQKSPGRAFQFLLDETSKVPPVSNFWGQRHSGPSNPQGIPPPPGKNIDRCLARYALQNCMSWLSYDIVYRKKATATMGQIVPRSFCVQVLNMSYCQAAVPLPLHTTRDWRPRLVITPLWVRAYLGSHVRQAKFWVVFLGDLPFSAPTLWLTRLKMSEIILSPPPHPITTTKKEKKFSWLIKIRHPGIKWASSRENLSSGFSTKVDSNRPAQLQKLGRGLKFRVQKLEVLYYLGGENKGVIRLCGCAGWVCAFVVRIWHKQVFSWCGSNEAWLI